MPARSGSGTPAPDAARAADGRRQRAPGLAPPDRRADPVRCDRRYFTEQVPSFGSSGVTEATTFNAAAFSFAVSFIGNGVLPAG